MQCRYQALLQTSLTPRLERLSQQLVIPFRHSFRSNDAYQFVVPDSQRGNETLAHFQTWLVDAARRFSDAPAA